MIKKGRNTEYENCVYLNEIVYACGKVCNCHQRINKKYTQFDKNSNGIATL